MTPNILLLDCSFELKEKLERQGFSVSSGTVGFSSGIRNLPSQVYENEVIVYNPTFIRRNSRGELIREEEIQDMTPEFSLSHLKQHVMDGATVLVIANHLVDSIDHRHPYSWMPFMPRLMQTKDQRIQARSNFTNWHHSHLMLRFLDVNEIATPVRLKIKLPTQTIDDKEDPDEVYKETFEVVPLLHNQKGETLGVSFRFGRGSFFVLPSFKSNDDFIATFLNKVVPEVHGVETRRNIIDDFASPQQQKAEESIEKTMIIRKEAEKRLENAQEQLVQAKLQKTKTIREDETAVLAMNYYGLAQQQSDVALFYLYKVIEVLENKYGNEKEAKRQLKHNEEWNLIGRVANASYADVRHAPKPGEKIKQWTSEEISQCFDAASKIIHAYFATLFGASEVQELTATHQEQLMSADKR